MMRFQEYNQLFLKLENKERLFLNKEEKIQLRSQYKNKRNKLIYDLGDIRGMTLPIGAKKK